MPRNEVDPSLITNEPRKRKLASYVTNKDNISADKDEMVKRIKCTIDPGEYHNRSSMTLFLTSYQAAPLSRFRSQSPTVEEVEDEDMYQQVNIPPKNPLHVLEPSDN